MFQKWSKIFSELKMESPGGGRSPFATLKNIVSLANRGTVSPRRFSMVSIAVVFLYFMRRERDCKQSTERMEILNIFVPFSAIHHDS